MVRRWTSPATSMAWWSSRPTRSQQNALLQQEHLVDWVVKPATNIMIVLDQGSHLERTRPWNITKHAMFLATVIVGHVHIFSTFVTVLQIVNFFIKGVIPRDTVTATMATTNMVFGMLRHHLRMVPVATLAGNLRVLTSPLELFQKNSSNVCDRKSNEWLITIGINSIQLK